ncbi:hypothetical protein B296_00054772 [Ensete ventricosum]|uniref:Uncharacterized protein n=1 Tax=Ensete ventricosum TaxID=4639 RepID=A0A426X5F5_ENSVE|nr:hypothetical protein B296_00054772 [Ensete ventricosum]
MAQGGSPEEDETHRKIIGGSQKACRETNYEEAMELQPDDGSRSCLSTGPGFRRCSGISSKFARRFVKGIGKLVRNTPGDR